MITALVDDPVASASEQFALSRSRHAPPCHDLPSAAGVRPWGLRGMRSGTITGRAVPKFVYSHEQQLAVDEAGRPLIVTGMADPSADSVSDGDGDEGRSEDWTYDFVPDNPYPA
ncbi:MAG: putative ATP-grasp-modified RiPP [Pseudonocardiaceae bacterium]